MAETTTLRDQIAKLPADEQALAERARAAFVASFEAQDRLAAAKRELPVKLAERAEHRSIFDADEARRRMEHEAQIAARRAVFEAEAAQLQETCDAALTERRQEFERVDESLAARIADLEREEREAPGAIRDAEAEYAVATRKLEALQGAKSR